MPRLTKIYTRTGDDGTTGLGTGARVPKTTQRIVAYGAVDELNAVIGTAVAAYPDEKLATTLRSVQNDLFHLGADLCIPDTDKPKMPGPKIERRHIDRLEQNIDKLNAHLKPLENFILPGGSMVASQLHHARTVCRRAEIEVLRLADDEQVSTELKAYINRLSDFLFVAARYQNNTVGNVDPIWDSRA